MLTDIIYQILTAVQGAYHTIYGYATRLTFYFLVIDIALFGIYVAMGKSASIESIVEKILSIAFFIWLINSFRDLSMLFLKSIIKVTSSVAGNFDPTFFTNPSAVLEYASSDILQPLLKTVTDAQPKGFMQIDIGLWMIFGIAWICVMLCFVIIALQLAIANIEFYIITLMGLVLIPFCILEQTRFIGLKVFPAVAGQTIKVGVATLIAGVGINIFKAQIIIPDASHINGHFLVMLIGSSILLAFLGLQIPALASSMLSGTPNLSLSGFVQNVSGAISMGRSVGNVANNVGNNIRDRASNAVQTAKNIGAEAKNTLNKYFKG